MQLIEVHQGEQHLIDPFIRPPICLLLIAVSSLLTILIVKPWSIDLRKSHRTGLSLVVQWSTMKTSDKCSVNSNSIIDFIQELPYEEMPIYSTLNQLLKKIFQRLGFRNFYKCRYSIIWNYCVIVILRNWQYGFSYLWINCSPMNHV